MSSFSIDINEQLVKSIVSDRMYKSDASAFREQYVNALSHGCVAYHTEYGYTDDVYVHVLFDLGHRKVTITDNGMGMSERTFRENFMAFGRSTVDENTNNTRSGMWGLGAISFYRIATICIVESKDRKTGEHFAFMTRNTDESEFVSNRTLEHFGTKTEIFLKESVKIETLIDMVRAIAVNYPVKTVIETINAEEEQSINSYHADIGDSYQEFTPIHTFEDYVKESTDSMYTKIHDDEELEVYLSTQRREATNAFLCRIPIGMNYHTFGFYVFANIKQEKRMGIDDRGRERLIEIPKPDRDEITEESEEYFVKKIQDSIDTILYKIDVTSYDEFLKSDERWILSGYSVDDKLNPKTREFVSKLRHMVKYRNSSGIQKRSSSILDLCASNENIFYHPTLNKSSHDSVSAYLGKDIITIDDTGGLPIQDIREYKKKYKIKASASSTTTRTHTFKVRGFGHYYAVDYNPDQWDEVYYVGDMFDQHDLKFYGGEKTKPRIGFVVAKSAKKHFPSIDEKIKEFDLCCKEGKVVYNGKNIESMSSLKEIIKTRYSLKAIPIEFKDSLYRGTKYQDQIIYAPKNMISFIKSITSMYRGSIEDSFNTEGATFKHFLEIMKYKKSVLNQPKYHDIVYDWCRKYTGRYSYNADYKDVIRYNATILEWICYGIKKTVTEWSEFREECGSLGYRYASYDDIYPESYDLRNAESQGFDKVIEIEGVKYMATSGTFEKYNSKISIMENGGEYHMVIDNYDGMEIRMHEGKPYLTKLLH